MEKLATKIVDKPWGKRGLDPRFGVDPDRQVGEIWFEGPSVASGYWNAEAASEAGFRSLPSVGAGRFVRTGDLGFVDAGELFVVGRRKDVIKLFGRAWHPQDLEQTIEAGVPEMRPGGCVAFGCAGESERVGVVAEVRASCLEAADGRTREER